MLFYPRSLSLTLSLTTLLPSSASLLKPSHRHRNIPEALHRQEKWIGLKVSLNKKYFAEYDRQGLRVGKGVRSG